MELDDERVKKWDRAADDMIATKVIVSRMETRLKEMNGTVADLKAAQLIQKGVMIATFAIITVAGTVSGIVVAVITLGG